MMRIFSSILTAGAVSLAAMGSAAALEGCPTTGHLASASGLVIVDTGEGFQRGVIGTSLKTGDQIVVHGEGNAIVDFGNDRTMTVASSTIETVRVPDCGQQALDSSGMKPASSGTGETGALAYVPGAGAGPGAGPGPSGLSTGSGPSGLGSRAGVPPGGCAGAACGTDTGSTNGHIDYSYLNPSTGIGLTIGAGGAMAVGVAASQNNSGTKTTIIVPVSP